VAAADHIGRRRAGSRPLQSSRSLLRKVAVGHQRRLPGGRVVRVAVRDHLVSEGGLERSGYGMPADAPEGIRAPLTWLNGYQRARPHASADT
jgi:hypothetical protein